MKRKAIIVLTAGFLLLILLLTYIYFNHSTSHTITIKNGAFYPSHLQIKSGDIAVFKTDDGMPFWPASDLHPTHSVYSEFDPMMPVPSTESWSFKFLKKGKWNFHNHLAPSQRGSIQVH